jgi:uncharacterized protein (TIGR02421 family)
MFDPAEVERIKGVDELLFQAARPVKVLSALAWPQKIRERFLETGGEEFPAIEYPPFDPTPTIELVRAARRNIFPGDIVDDWLDRTAEAIENGALMLSTRGTNAFAAYGRELYGGPREPLRHQDMSPSDLAERIIEVTEQLHALDVQIPDPPPRSAEDVAAIIEPAVQVHFGDDAPALQIVDELSANALASPSRIRLRRDAIFTDRDADQLLNHEAYIHVGTSLNGRAQPAIKILGAGHPGTTRTQEGLAVYAEMMSGTMELDRFRRLAERVVAVRMVVDGADFIELFRWFRERTRDEVQAFESTRRVFRGGVLTGGAPFFKDIVYLAGLLEVTTFVRGAFAANRADSLGLLFCGKLDVWDIPALAVLRSHGLCQRAKYVPPWVADPRGVLAQLTWQTFLARLDLDHAMETVERMLARTAVFENSG